MAYIGNRTHAASVIDLSWGETPGYGWRVAGSGGSRTALLHVDSGVVYKYDRYSETGAYGCGQEVRLAQNFWRAHRDGYVGTQVRIPRTSGYRFNGGSEYVVAMEYVEKHPTVTQVEDSAYWELYCLGFQDMHKHNFIIDKDRYLVPIDLASPMRQGHGDIRTLDGTRFYDDENKRRFPRRH